MNIIYQKDPVLNPVIQKYGCLFLSILYHAPKTITEADANVIWDLCVQRGIITGDLNADGDFDDIGEAVLKSHQKLLDILEIPARYDNKHHTAEEEIPDGVLFAIGGFKYNILHFVNIDKDKRVVNDPLRNSLSVSMGKLETMRWYWGA